jgi:hypothetical protein
MKKNPAAVALGKRRAASLTPEHQKEAVRARWGSRPMCACGCGLTLARAQQRHPARAKER